MSEQVAEVAETPAETPAEAPVNETLAESPVEERPVETPATWPENWRELLTDDPDELSTLKRWKDPKNILKQNKELRQKLSSREYRRPMPDGDDEDALKAWRAEVGVPDAPEGYLESIEVEFGDDEKPMVDDYLARMHAAGADTKAVADGLNWYFEAQEKAIEQRAEIDRQLRQESEDALRSEWGPEYRANLNSMHSLLDAHAPEGLKERFFSARFDDGRLFGDDPDALRFLVEVGRELYPHGTVTPQPGKTESETVKGRIGELRAMMAQRSGEYWNGPNSESLQAEYKNLLEIEEKMKR